MCGRRRPHLRLSEAECRKQNAEESFQKLVKRGPAEAAVHRRARFCQEALEGSVRRLALHGQRGACTDCADSPLMFGKQAGQRVTSCHAPTCSW